MGAWTGSNVEFGYSFRLARLSGGPGGATYLRPDGTSYYLRPDGTSFYLRP